MIARIWIGRTRPEHSDDYLNYLLSTGVVDQQSSAGNRGSWVLRRFEDDFVEFMVLSLWDSLEQISAFAGADVERARYYPEDRKFLLALPAKVTHFEVAYGSPEQD